MTCTVLTLCFPRNECTVRSGSTPVLLCLDHPVQCPSTLAGTSLVASAHTSGLVGQRAMDVAFSHMDKLHFSLCCHFEWQSACLCNLRECNSELINNYQIDLATKETSQGFSGIRAMKWCLFVDFSCICRILCCSRALAQWTWGPEQGKLWLCGALCLLGYEVGDAHSWSRIWVAPSQGSSSKASLWAEWMDLAAV